MIITLDSANVHPATMSFLNFIVTSQEGDSFSDRADFKLNLPGVGLQYNDPNCILIDTIDSKPAYYQLQSLESSGGSITGRIYTNGKPSSSFSLRCYFITPEATLTNREGTITIDFDGKSSSSITTTFPFSTESDNSLATISAKASGDASEAMDGFNLKLSNLATQTSSFPVSTDGAYFYNLTPLPEGSTDESSRPNASCTITSGENVYPAEFIMSNAAENSNRGTRATISPIDSITFTQDSSVSIVCPNIAVASSISFYEPILDIADESESYTSHTLIDFQNTAGTQFIVNITTLALGLAILAAVMY